MLQHNVYHQQPTGLGLPAMSKAEDRCESWPQPSSSQLEAVVDMSMVQRLLSNVASGRLLDLGTDATVDDRSRDR